MPRAVMTALFVLIALTGTLRAAPPEKVEQAGVALVLALDGSASITTGDLEFQLQGHAAAFRDPAVAEALASARARVTLTAYSGPNSLKVLIPWTALAKPEDAGRFADRIDAQGFTIDNPNAGGSCACGDSFH